MVGCQRERMVDYNVDVKPILNKRCISCHGGVRQNGGFNLLTRDLAMAPTESGQAAIVPGSAKKSGMFHRITAEDPDIRMPLDQAPLPAEEVEILRKWINDGAPWDVHWAYRPLTEIEPPQEVLLGSLEELPEMQAIDRFVQAKLSQVGMGQLSPPAGKSTLLRRISLDLIGMPAPEALQTWYLNQDDPTATEQLIDSLLQLRQFGEKWASMWLDLARYADSKGYERDPHRNIWRYRDWVIRAFNGDMPYDQFIVEQLAGDMLPDPTNEQLLATGFHRNTSTNDEGGTDNEEYRVYAIFDRVNTTYEALMSTTMACVQCHGHPYDPFNHSDYYASMAFLNNTRDGDTSPDYPGLRHFDAIDSARFADLKGWFAQHLPPEEQQKIATFIKTWMPSWHSIEVDSLVNAALYDMKYLGLRQYGQARLRNVDLTDHHSLFIRYQTSRHDGRWSLRLDNPSEEAFFSTILPSTDGKWDIVELTLPLAEGFHDIYMQYQSPSIPEDNDDRHVTFDWFYFSDIKLPWSQDVTHLYQDIFWDLLKAKVPATPIMLENPEDMKRVTYRLDRGNFMVPDEVVAAKIPEALGHWPDDLPKNRLGFAQWIVSEDHPLTARTWVNRIWAQLFGRGLVETLEDFGSQGATPSHPALLDWLAWHMVHEHDWSLKAFLKMVMLSRTYQQQSVVSPQMLELDPQNIYLARGPRVRLSAEQIRDQALWVSRLLNSEMYGPSVMPFQPIQWQTPYSNEQWKTATDGQQYRRAVYTYWKRSLPYPAMMIFDAAERNVCTARRIPTNTPLHALVTLNDPVFMEAAASFAGYMTQSANTISEQIQSGYRRMFAEEISERELEVLVRFHQNAKTELTDGSAQSEKITAYLKEGKTALDRASVSNDVDLAALVMVANTMMNTDAFISKY